MIKPLFRQVALLCLLHWMGLQCAMAIEEPSYKTLVQEGRMEVRLYDSRLSAVTHLNGDMDQASNQGFRRIADFIFRSNTTANASSPSSDARAEKIAMTAPVIVQPQGLKDTRAEYKSSENWAVEFVMPKEYTLESLPKPLNPQVEITVVPAKTYAALTHTGFNTQSKVQQEIDALTAWIQTKGWSIVGAPQLARYDPPWTLPFWRRNEIWIELKPLP